MTNSSAHANCSHDATKSARAKCRRNATQPINVSSDIAEYIENAKRNKEAAREEYAALCKAAESE